MVVRLMRETRTRMEHSRPHVSDRIPIPPSQPDGHMGNPADIPWSSYMMRRPGVTHPDSRIQPS